MLALIAGSGLLPKAIIAALDTRPLVCALDGHVPDGVEPDLGFRVETVGTLIAELKTRGVTQVCFCGRIDRPDRVDVAQLDAATLPFADGLQKAIGLGDDGALRLVLEMFVQSGLVPVAAHVAAPDLLPPAGVLTQTQPVRDAEALAQLGDAALSEMGVADLGQACVVHGSAVIARETQTGTDALLANLVPDAVRGGVFYKAPKPGQDRRADLPVIGPETVLGARAAGLSGLIIEAQGVMVLQRAEVLNQLEAAGMFLWVRQRPSV